MHLLYICTRGTIIQSLKYYPLIVLKTVCSSGFGEKGRKKIKHSIRLFYKALEYKEPSQIAIFISPPLTRIENKTLGKISNWIFWFIIKMAEIKKRKILYN